MKGVSTSQKQTNDLVIIQNSTAHKINKRALFFFTCSLIFAAATITTAILYQGTARFWIVGTGGTLTIVFLILGFKSNKKGEPELEIHYRDTFVGAFDLPSTRLTLSGDLNSTQSTSSDINKDLEMGYKQFVDTHGTAPFEKGQIPLASKEFQDVFVKYIMQELHITEFLNSKYCGNFLLKFNLIQVVNKDFAIILPKIKELSTSTKEPSVINHQWQVWLKLRVSGLGQDRHLKQL